jgi:protein-S-isoprenylcysteine O-methyltransferase Ste14
MTNILLSIPWVIIIVFWGWIGISQKPDLKKETSWIYLLKAKNVVTAIIISQFLPLKNLWLFQNNDFNYSVVIFGFILCYVGIFLAIWSRIKLGDNWSGTPSIKVSHELITTGPYKLIRHPIYAGLLLAFLGSSLVGPHLWFLVFVFYIFLYGYKISVEEKLMMSTFLNEWTEYKKNSKMLIPFIV